MNSEPTQYLKFSWKIGYTFTIKVLVRIENKN